MVKIPAYFLAIFLFFSCNNKQADAPVSIQKDTAISSARESFFPVTTFLKGQIREIATGGINPLKYTTVNKKTDSAWVKIEDLNSEAASFLQPIIDTANLFHLFSETKFLDQTLNAYTFTYEPLKQLPDGFPLQHWDVYVDPVSNKVTRIYMVKKLSDTQTSQLTWQTDKWFKIVNLGIDKSNKTIVEKEVLIKWDF